MLSCPLPPPPPKFIPVGQKRCLGGGSLLLGCSGMKGKQLWVLEGPLLLMGGGATYRDFLLLRGAPGVSAYWRRGGTSSLVASGAVFFLGGVSRRFLHLCLGVPAREGS